MAKTVIDKGSASHDTRVKVFETSIEDGNWHKLLVSHYNHVMSIFEHPFNTLDLVHQVKMGQALLNIEQGFYNVVDGTMLLRKPDLQKQIFDQFIDVIAGGLREDKLLKYLNSSDYTHKPIRGIIKYMILAIHNFMFYYETCIPALRDHGLLSAARYIRENSDDSYTRVNALIIIAYLIEESDDKEQMKMSTGELDFLMFYLRYFVYFGKRISGHHPEELINGLDRIAVIDVNKLQLIDNGILPLLTKSLDQTMEYSVEHQEAAVKLIWNLAFTDKSKQKIKEEDGLMSALLELKKSEHKGIRTAVAGALWQLEDKEQHKKEVDSKLQSGIVKQNEQHIMLSYNHSTEKPVLKMRDILAERGYKVWIDVDQITKGGSILGAMAAAVEDSCVVLIFLCEAYYNSQNCRSEGEYVYEMRKPYFPIQVQPGYTPRGWLGIMCGSKYRYTMCNPGRNESDMASLLKEIEEEVKYRTNVEEPVRPSVAVGPADDVAVPAVLSSTSGCGTWSAEQVTEWLDRNSLNQYQQRFDGVDGEMLAELVMLSHNHVDTFYSLNCKPDLIGILKLGASIKKL